MENTTIDPNSLTASIKTPKKYFKWDNEKLSLFLQQTKLTKPWEASFGNIDSSWTTVISNFADTTTADNSFNSTSMLKVENAKAKFKELMIEAEKESKLFESGGSGNGGQVWDAFKQCKHDVYESFSSFKLEKKKKAKVVDKKESTNVKNVDLDLDNDLVIVNSSDIRAYSELAQQSSERLSTVQPAVAEKRQIVCIDDDKEEEKKKSKKLKKTHNTNDQHFETLLTAMSEKLEVDRESNRIRQIEANNLVNMQALQTKTLTEMMKIFVSNQTTDVSSLKMTIGEFDELKKENDGLRVENEALRRDGGRLEKELEVLKSYVELLKKDREI